MIGQVRVSQAISDIVTLVLYQIEAQMVAF